MSEGGRSCFSLSPYLPFSHLPAGCGRGWCLIRLRPHTHTRPKPLLPVAGQPILGHILDPLLAVGIRRIVLVTGHMGEQIVEYVRS